MVKLIAFHALFIAAIFFVNLESISGAQQCYGCNSTIDCKTNVISCTADTALTSIYRLNSVFKLDLPTQNLSTTYDCFYNGVNSTTIWSDNTHVNNFQLEKGCLPSNVKICPGQPSGEDRAYIVAIGVSSFCNQTNASLSNTGV